MTLMGAKDDKKARDFLRNRSVAAVKRLVKQYLAADATRTRADAISYLSQLLQRSRREWQLGQEWNPEAKALEDKIEDLRTEEVRLLSWEGGVGGGTVVHAPHPSLGMHDLHP